MPYSILSILSGVSAYFMQAVHEFACSNLYYSFFWCNMHACIVLFPFIIIFSVFPRFAIDFRFLCSSVIFISYFQLSGGILVSPEHHNIQTSKHDNAFPMHSLHSVLYLNYILGFFFIVSLFLNFSDFHSVFLRDFGVSSSFFVYPNTLYMIAHI